MSKSCVTNKSLLRTALTRNIFIYNMNVLGYSSYEYLVTDITRRLNSLIIHRDFDQTFLNDIIGLRRNLRSIVNLSDDHNLTDYITSSNLNTMRASINAILVVLWDEAKADPIKGPQTTGQQLINTLTAFKHNSSALDSPSSSRGSTPPTDN